jgi:hypothetical protein
MGDTKTSLKANEGIDNHKKQSFLYPTMQINYERKVGRHNVNKRPFTIYF